MTRDQLTPSPKYVVYDYWQDDSTERQFILCWLGRRLKVSWSGPLSKPARERQATERMLMSSLYEEDPF